VGEQACKWVREWVREEARERACERTFDVHVLVELNSVVTQVVHHVRARVAHLVSGALLRVTRARRPPWSRCTHAVFRSSLIGEERGELRRVDACRLPRVERRVERENGALGVRIPAF
jgi:hypothetical protein